MNKDFRQAYDMACRLVDVLLGRGRQACLVRLAECGQVPGRVVYEFEVDGRRYRADGTTGAIDVVAYLARHVVLTVPSSYPRGERGAAHER